jgi:hypothetical protein
MVRTTGEAGISSVDAVTTTSSFEYWLHKKKAGTVSPFEPGKVTV